MSERVHIYCRVSTSGQEDNTSLDTQEAACRRWAQERGLPVDSVAREVWSGGDRHRPELDAMLDRLSAGDVVLAYDLDRLSRGGQIDTAVIIDRIGSVGASVAFVLFDFEQSETGALIRNVRAFSAALEKEKIAERTQRGLRARVASGKPLVGGKPPYGYVWVDAQKSRLDLDPETAPAVRLIFDWALAGTSLRGICALLADRGFPPRADSGTGQPPSCAICCSPGLYRGWGGVPGAGGASEPRHEGAAGAALRRGADRLARCRPGPCHARGARGGARAVARQPSAQHPQQPDAGAVALAGRIRPLWACQRAMTAANPTATRPTTSPLYRCENRDDPKRDCPHPSISAGILDPAVWDGVCEILRDPTIIAKAVAVQRSDGGLERELTTVERRLAALVNKHQTGTKRLLIVDDATADTLADDLRALGAEMRGVEAERDDLHRRIADAAADTARLRSLSEWCQTVAGNLDSLTYDDRRLALATLGVRVHVHCTGSVTEQGRPLPRWIITGDPASLDTDVPSLMGSRILYAPFRRDTPATRPERKQTNGRD